MPQNTFSHTPSVSFWFLIFHLPSLILSPVFFHLLLLISPVFLYSVLPSHIFLSVLLTAAAVPSISDGFVSAFGSEAC